MKATATRTERTETVTIEKKVPTITLELSMEQAITLATIGRSIGGSPETTIRGFMDSINDALRAAGVKALEWPVNIRQKELGAIYFNEESVKAMHKVMGTAPIAPTAPALRVGLYKTENGYQFWDGNVWGKYSLSNQAAARAEAGEQTSYPPKSFEWVGA